LTTRSPYALKNGSTLLAIWKQVMSRRQGDRSGETPIERGCLGAQTLNAFKAMERYNPTKGWVPVLDK
jgi:hypothetical protein